MPQELQGATPFKSKSELASRIGNTPMVRIGMGGDASPIFVKMESANPSGSIRDRYVAEIVELAMMAGQVERGDTLALAGLDDSAVAAAFVAHQLGLTLKVYAPENCSRRLLDKIQIHGAEVEWTPAEGGLRDATSRAAAFARAQVGRFYVDGYRRTAVKDAYRAVAQEILDALEGVPLGGFVTSVSTGATFREVSHALRETQPSLEVRGARIVEDEPKAEENPFISQIHSSEAWAWRDRILEEEGLLLSPKGAVCVKLAMQLQSEVNPGVAIVALNPDDGERYLGWEDTPVYPPKSR